MVAKDPADRQQSMSEVIEALGKACEGDASLSEHDLGSMFDRLETQTKQISEQKYGSLQETQKVDGLTPTISSEFQQSSFPTESNTTDRAAKNTLRTAAIWTGVVAILGLANFFLPTSDETKQAEIREPRIEPSIPQDESHSIQSPQPAPTVVNVLHNGWVIEEPVNLGPVVNYRERDGGPALSADGQTLIFHSVRPGGQGGRDLWMTERNAPGKPFGKPVNLGPAVNSSEIESHPTLSADGRTLIFARGTLSSRDLWMSTRTIPSEPFGHPVRLKTVNSSESDGHPDLSDNGRTLIFTSNRDGIESFWIAKRSASGEPFGQPEELDLAFDGVVEGPTVSNDGLMLIFGSNRSGGQGNFDLWMSTRLIVDDSFGEPVNLGKDFNSVGFDTQPCLTDDGHSLFFESTRPGGHGAFDLWMARIRRPDLTKSTPPFAVAPFDEEKAKQHQKAWTGHLGVPVEKSVELPGGGKMAFVLIPPGEFMMGSTDEDRARFVEQAKRVKDQWSVDRIPHESPQHRVRLTQPFYLGKYEVTQAQWLSVMETNRSKFNDGQMHPVEMVSWVDAQSFLAKLNKSQDTKNNIQVAHRIAMGIRLSCGVRRTVLPRRERRLRKQTRMV